MDISSIEFRKSIYHEVFQIGTDKKIPDPSFEKHTITFEDKTARLFRKRLADALGSDSHCISLCEGNNSILPKIKELLDATNDSQFIKISEDIAKRLAKNQKTRSIPGGILFIVTGVAGVDLNPFVALMKSEPQNGLAREKAESGGTKLQYINELLMTKEKKLYKVGMFVKTGDTFEIKVYDESMNIKDTLQPATYYYRDFMGCALAPTNSAYTLEFYLHSKALIKESDWSVERKVDVADGLYCYLKLEQNKTASVQEFANRYLVDDKEVEYFVNGFEGKPCSENAFNKDLQHLKNKLRKRNLEFQHGIKIVGSPENLKEYVKIKDAKETVTLVEIKGKMVNQ